MTVRFKDMVALVPGSDSVIGQATAIEFTRKEPTWWSII